MRVGAGATGTVDSARWSPVPSAEPFVVLRVDGAAAIRIKSYGPYPKKIMAKIRIKTRGTFTGSFVSSAKRTMERAFSTTARTNVGKLLWFVNGFERQEWPFFLLDNLDGGCMNDVCSNELPVRTTS